MKRIAILVLVYMVGGVSGAVYHSVTAEAADRGRIAALESQIGERNEKLDKCTTALIENLHSPLLRNPRKPNKSLACSLPLCTGIHPPNASFSVTAKG